MQTNPTAILTLLFFAGAVNLWGGESTTDATDGSSPLWMMHPAISPDGSTIAFDYCGDIYTVDAKGGRARQITTNNAYDAMPVWSPDGKSLAFASDRHGSLDVFVIPACSGKAVRLTTHSSSEIPLAFVNDTTVLFSASIQPSETVSRGAFGPQVYSVHTTAGRAPRLYCSLPMTAVSVNAANNLVLYQDRKGYEDVLRKHEHSSGTADIWLIDNDGNHKQLTATAYNNHTPVWISDSVFVYTSETDGTMNVFRRSVSDAASVQLTFHKNHPVRSLSASSGGRILAYAYNGELYTLSSSGAPKKVDVEIVTDCYDADLSKSLCTSGATSMAVSPSGDEVAFVIRGDIYVTSVKYKTTRRITNTPYQERNVCFSKDGRMLVYDSERHGQWSLFTASIDNAVEKQFAYATSVTESLLYTPVDSAAAQQPVFSPDGKKVAFLEGRTALRVIDLNSKVVNTALDGRFNYSYSDGDISFAWSPDSRWLLVDYIGVGGWNNPDIACVRADGSQVVDLTESGYADGNPQWALGGKAVTYETSRYGYRSHGSWGEQTDIVLMALDPQAWDEFNYTEEEAALAEKSSGDKDDSEGKDTGKGNGKDAKKKSKKKPSAGKKDDAVKPLVFDFDNRQYRTRRLTGSSTYVGDYRMSSKGDKLFYSAPATEGGYNLYEADLRKGSAKILAKGISGGFEMDAKGDNLFVISRGGLKKVSLKDGKTDAIEFEALYERHPSLEREYIFEHCLKQVQDKFYDKNLHGVDWKMYGDNYRRFLPHINNNYDFATLLSELLGELNASHTGGRYRPGSISMPTASLGAFYDSDYEGEGLKIKSVIARSPLSSASVGAKSGDVITAIDGLPIASGADYFPMLEGKAGKKVKLTLRNAKGDVRTVDVRPISQGRLNELLYQRWVERNQAMVDSLSDGQLAYVHVQGMDSPSYRRVYSQLLGKYRNRKGVIVDTRWNGGGWLHNDIALLLGGREYVRYSPRGQYVGSDPFSQWTKPSVMLINESNYSDAHGTPYVYKTLGIGKLVGAPVPGTMTAVWWETQIDPTLIFGIPQVTSLDRQGHPLENQQLDPDVLQYNNPLDVLSGHDAQIEAAVRTLLDQLK